MKEKIQNLTLKELESSIEELSKSYGSCKRTIEVNDAYGVNFGDKDINNVKAVKYTFDLTIDQLKGLDYIIIDNEVRKGRDGYWYLEYMSVSTYYRVRKKAYTNFIRCLY